MKNIFYFILTLLITITVTVFIVREYYPRVQIIETPIDENSWVSMDVYTSERNINRQLRRENEELQSVIEQRNERITQLTTISGMLNLEVDSLKESVQRYKIDLQQLQNNLVSNDSLEQDVPLQYTFNRTFGNGLFLNRADVTIEGGYISSELFLEQLRPVELSVVNTISNDGRSMFTYVTSTDFDSLRVEKLTTIKKSRLNWWHWMLIGTTTGAILVNTLD